MTLATRWMFGASTEPVGNPGIAMTAVTLIGKSSYFAIAD
jgi:hypothetical protein